MPFIYSTSSASTIFNIHGPQPADPNSTRPILKKIHIQGGANVVARGNNIITPTVLGTEVTNEEMELLLAHPSFKIAVANGHLKVVDKILSEKDQHNDLASKDKSAPKTPQDFAKNDGRTQPKLASVGKVETR